MLHMGKALYDFANNVATTETKLGEFSSTERGGETDLIVSGHSIFTEGEPGYILTDINTTIDTSSRFKRVYNKSVMQMAKAYAEKAGIDKAESDVIVDKLTKINASKMLVVTLKPETECIVRLVSQDGTKYTKQGTISAVKWRTNTDNNKLECSVVISTSKHNGNSYIVKLVDYLKTFYIASLSQTLGQNNMKNDIVQLTNYGFIKPIVVTHENAGYAVDGTYLYKIDKNVLDIVGKWNIHGKIDTHERTSKALKVITDNIDIINAHKAYMAPYLTYESNNISV